MNLYDCSPHISSLYCAHCSCQDPDAGHSEQIACLTRYAQQDEIAEVASGRTCRVRVASARQMAFQDSLDSVVATVEEQGTQLAAHEQAILCLQNGAEHTNARCDRVDADVRGLQRDNRALKSQYDFLSKTLQGSIIYQNRQNSLVAARSKRKAVRLSEDSSQEDEVCPCSSINSTTHIVTAVRRRRLQRALPSELASSQPGPSGRQSVFLKIPHRRTRFVLAPP